jgi:precorrin-8X/cobalt-precorrin-8 methylmutase
LDSAAPTKPTGQAMMAAPPVPSMVVSGRLGGSAITVAAINALASRREI